jgi:arylsulfatase A-like enzyme
VGAERSRPNVLVVLTDQQRWDTTGVHGNPMGLTPNFDRMAWEGTHLHQSFTVQPVCGPARSCMQTGRYATTTGCWRNGIPLPEQAHTLAHHFGGAGYDTGYIGKWHLAGEEPVSAARRGGYDYWLAADVLEFSSDAYDTVLFDGEGRRVKLPGYRVDALTDAAIRYLDGGRERPFFLFLSYMEPHQQNRRDEYVAPDGYRERYTGGWIPPDLAALGGSAHQHLPGYYGAVKRVDEALGRLRDALKSLGMLQDTIVLFTSDHGCHFRTREGEFKRSCHESSIRVPTAISGPGFDGGGRVRRLTSIIDLPPTLLDAAGLPVPEEMQGKSVLPLLHGRGEGWPEEVFVQISESQVGRAVRTERWKYAVAAPELDGWRHSGAQEYVETHLYDLRTDPYELTNLVGLESHRRVAEVMRERLLRRMELAGEGRPKVRAATPRSQGPWRLGSDAEAYE